MCRRFFGGNCVTFGFGPLFDKAVKLGSGGEGSGLNVVWPCGFPGGLADSGGFRQRSGLASHWIVLALCLDFQANSSWRHQNQPQLVPSWGWAHLHWVGGECRILCIFSHCGFGPHVCNDPCDRSRLRPLVRTPKAWGFAVWAFVELLGLSRVQDCFVQLTTLISWVSHTLLCRMLLPCSECLFAMGKNNARAVQWQCCYPFPMCSEVCRATGHQCWYCNFWSLMSQRCLEALVEFMKVKADDRIFPWRQVVGPPALALAPYRRQWQQLWHGIFNMLHKWKTLCGL